MKLPDGSTLMHAGRPYDPQKAHAYYMRTRKLKGRKKGGTLTDLNKKKSAKGAVKPKKKRATPQQRAEARQKIMDLTKRLAEQQDALKKAMSEAKGNAKKSAAKAKTSAKEAKKPPTKAEKAEAAREAKKYADKNKSKIKSKKAAATASGGGSSKPSALTGAGSKAESAKKEKVAGLQKKVEETASQLNDAIAKYRALG